jgi:hypothetical protein
MPVISTCNCLSCEAKRVKVQPKKPNRILNTKGVIKIVWNLTDIKNEQFFVSQVSQNLLPNKYTDRYLVERARYDVHRWNHLNKN